MRWVRAFASIAGGVSALTACTLLVSTEGLSGEPATPGAEGGDAPTSAPEGGADSGIDAAPDAAPTCDPSKPFGALVALTSPVSSPDNEYAGYFSPDLLTIYVSSARAGGGDLFVFQRSAVSSGWGAAVNLAEVNTAKKDSDPWVSADQLTIYFDSDRPSSFGATNLWMATRARVDQPFNTPVIVDGVQSNGNELEPWLVPGGEAIYFSSDRKGGGTGQDLYVSRRGGDGKFSTPSLLSELSSGATEESPFLTADERTIYFASSRPGGTGAEDVWTATRPNKDAPFGNPKPVPELNTASADYPTWLSDDGCRIVIESYAPGDAQLFYAERAK